LEFLDPHNFTGTLEWIVHQYPIAKKTNLFRMQNVSCI